MRKSFLVVLIGASLWGCGGSGSSSLSTTPGAGSFLSSTVQLDQQFIYALSTESSQLTAYKVKDEEDAGHDPHHGHAHARATLQHGHEHEHEHEHDHEHEHEHEHETGHSQFVELDSSPLQLPPGALSLVVAAEGSALIVLFEDGTLRSYPIDGVRGLLGDPVALASAVTSPRRLRVSPSGVALAVLGENLAIFTLDANGQPASGPSVIPETADWSDIALGDQAGVAATSSGAVGFSWQPQASVSVTSQVALPGAVRGGIALHESSVFVTNTDDQTVSHLNFEEATGALELMATLALPDEVVNPGALSLVFDGEDLLVAGDTAVALLHRHDDELEEEGHVEIDSPVTGLFLQPESSSVWVAQAQGRGFRVLSLAEELSWSSLQKPELEGFTSFGFARRVETLTVSQGL